MASSTGRSVRALVWAVLVVCAGSSVAAIPTPGQVATWVNTGDRARLTEHAVTVVQVSDTHIRHPSNDPLRSPELLRRVLVEVRQAYPQVAFVAATGDNTNGPSPKWREAFFDALRSAGLKTFAVDGNTDHGCYLGSWRPARPLPRGAYLRLPCTKHEIGDNVFVFLDSHLARCHEGCMRKDELLWLHRLLGAGANKNVFLFSHHGPDMLMNDDWLGWILRVHRPRYRQIVGVHGHEHRGRYVVRNGAHFVITSHLYGGLYRVFHVRPDAIITYMRRSSAWLAMKGVTDKPANRLASEPIIIPTEPRTARPMSQHDPTFQQVARGITWRANDADKPGAVLDLRFDTGERHVLFDKSGFGNDLYANSLYNRMRKHSGGRSPWVKRDKGHCIDFGTAGCFEAVGFDSYSLNSPARTNRVTVSAEVNVSAQPMGWDYGIVGKGVYELNIDKRGTAGFAVWVQGPKRKKRLVVRTPEPLAPGQWHKLSGTFDGKAVRLYLNGKPAGDAQCEPGSKLLASNGPVVVGFYVRHPKGAPERRLLIDNVSVRN